MADSMTPSPGPPVPTDAATPPVRLEWVTWLRALAILGVVSIHNSGTTAAQQNPWSLSSGRLAIVTDMPFVVMVPIFVMLAGTLGLSPQRFPGPARYLRKRASRLIAPLIVWHALYIWLNLRYDQRFPHTPVRIAERVLTGKVAPHLYFFWIIIALSLLSPLLVGWVSQSRRPEWVATGLGLALMTVVQAGLRVPLGLTDSFVATAFTWWVPFLGYYVLGWALRGVVWPRWAGLVSLLVGVAVIAFATSTWRQPAYPPIVARWFGISYYTLGTLVGTLAMFMAAQSLIRQPPTQPGAVRRTVSAAIGEVSMATMGIYGLHVAVLQVLTFEGVFPRGPLSGTALMQRLGLCLLITLPIVMVLRRIPFVRTIT